MEQEVKQHIILNDGRSSYWEELKDTLRLLSYTSKIFLWSGKQKYAR